jgi:hypothetical protein
MPGFIKQLEKMESRIERRKREQASKDRVVSIDNWRPNDQNKQWFVKANLPALPFHHLIPAEKLSSKSVADSSRKTNSRPPESARAKLRLFWQSLAANGISPKEASLLDDIIQYSSVESDVNGSLGEINWLVRHFDVLEGCGEIYRAEMLFFKRKIYEAGDRLRSNIELEAAELLPYLNNRAFIFFRKKRQRGCFSIVCGGLMNCPSALILDKTDTNMLPQKAEITCGRSKSKFQSNQFDAYRTLSAKRIESIQAIDDVVDDEDDNLVFDTPKQNPEYAKYRISLSDYWLLWQRAARAAKFDFDLLEEIDDARTIRFYELSKLLRSSSFQNNENEIPDKLKIEYEKFASLMPLPAYFDELEAKKKIQNLIKPLKERGYVKSFRLKSDWRNISGAYELVFRFSEKY